MPLNGVTTTLTPTNATDAQFRAWGSAISAKLLSAGHVQTGDTGQINWATVLTTAAANTAQGYEIWRLADTLQATAPIFIKWEFGSGTVTANLGIWLTFGTGSDGVGGLTGPISVRQQLTSTAYATNALSCFWSGSTSHFAAALFCGGTGTSTGNGHMICFERTKDSAGADTAAGLLVTWKTTASGFGQLFWDRALGTLESVATLGTLMCAGTTGKNGTQVAVYPIFHSNPVFLNPGINALAYHDADIVAKGAVTFTMYGTSRVYMPIGAIAFAGPPINGRSTAPTLMTRYD